MVRIAIVGPRVSGAREKACRGPRDSRSDDRPRTTRQPVSRNRSDAGPDDHHGHGGGGGDDGRDRGGGVERFLRARTSVATDPWRMPEGPPAARAGARDHLRGLRQAVAVSDDFVGRTGNYLFVYLFCTNTREHTQAQFDWALIRCYHDNNTI